MKRFLDTSYSMSIGHILCLDTTVQRPSAEQLQGVGTFCGACAFCRSLSNQTQEQTGSSKAKNILDSTIRKEVPEEASSSFQRTKQDDISRRSSWLPAARRCSLTPSALHGPVPVPTHLTAWPPLPLGSRCGSALLPKHLDIFTPNQIPPVKRGTGFT